MLDKKKEQQWIVRNNEEPLIIDMSDIKGNVIFGPSGKGVSMHDRITEVAGKDIADAIYHGIVNGEDLYEEISDVLKEPKPDKAKIINLSEGGNSQLN